jgi:hypothetical protein
MRERQAGRSSNAVCGLAAVFRANQNENSTVKRVLSEGAYVASVEASRRTLYFT